MNSTNSSPRLKDEAVHDLVTRAQHGDRDATDELLTLYYPMIRWAVGRYGRGSADTDNLEQEAGLAFIKAIDTWNGSTPFRTWLARGLKQRVWAELRREERHYARIELVEVEIERSVEAVPVMAAEELRRIAGGADLTDQEKVAIDMRLREASDAEIGAALGVGRRRANRIYHSAVAKMTRAAR